METFMTTTTRTPREVYWTGPIGPNDDFDAPIGDTFIDGKTTIGPWGIMTPANHERLGVGLGTGRGQKYVKQTDGRWLKVEG
jgi:hypothetical protein